jgi:hypothetical protein
MDRNTSANISDIYFVIDSARKNIIENVVSKGELVFSLKNKGINTGSSNSSATGLLLNTTKLVDVIEIEVGDIYLPLLPDYTSVISNWTSYYSTPNQAYPPLITNNSTYPVGSMSQYSNGIISLEIKEASPQTITTVDGVNITFLFSVSVVNNRLHLVPLQRKYIFTTPKQFQDTLTLSFKGPLAPLEFPPDILYNVKVDFQVLDPIQRVLEYDNIALFGISSNGFTGGVYDKIHNRIYLSPLYGIVGYIDLLRNAFVRYPEVDPIPNISDAYGSGVLIGNYIYWAPLFASNLTRWHYTNIEKNQLETYANNSGFQRTNDSAGCLYAYANPSNTRVYYMPLRPIETMYYVNVANNTVVAFNNNKYDEMIDAPTPAYSKAVMTSTGLLYFIPQSQQSQTILHYLNTNTNVMHSYSNLAIFIGSSISLNKFSAGVLSADTTKIYLIPGYQGEETLWYYIDLASNTIISYINNSTPRPISGESYHNGILMPDGKIYLVPYTQANESVWHYINTTNNTVIAYNNDAITSAVAGAYNDGVVIDDGSIYLIPYIQVAQAKWHYINFGTATFKFVYPNHGVVEHDRIFIENFYSSNTLIDNYLNRKIGLIVGNTTTTNEIYLNPTLDLKHNSIKFITYLTKGTYSTSVTIIINKNRFMMSLKFRTLVSDTTNKIIPV